MVGLLKNLPIIVADQAKIAYMHCIVASLIQRPGNESGDRLIDKKPHATNRSA